MADNRPKRAPQQDTAQDEANDKLKAMLDKEKNQEKEDTMEHQHHVIRSDDAEAHKPESTAGEQTAPLGVSTPVKATAKDALEQMTQLENYLNKNFENSEAMALVHRALADARRHMGSL